MEKKLDSLNGFIKDRIHYFHRRIYFADTDAAKVVYHAEYLKLAEQARTEMLRLRGLNYNFLKTNYNAHFAIHSLSINYSIPLKLDDEVIIKTFVKSLGGASIKMEQNFILYNSSEDSLISRLNIKVVLVNDKGSLIRLPKNISDELKCLVV
ncbi:MAG: YbgC/FadM family acyl-CoA thioesterase [Pseudomonadota bacterium]|nr:YbgC/FadM family acyl-CoA thioesterase [Pseudomonadota bacterium]|tara:strand:- start:186 stop:641 length:456 start_codon:yes stop_codon:yes gene_type:complete